MLKGANFLLENLRLSYADLVSNTPTINLRQFEYQRSTLLTCE